MHHPIDNNNVASTLVIAVEMLRWSWINRNSSIGLLTDRPPLRQSYIRRFFEIAFGRVNSPIYGAMSRWIKPQSKTGRCSSAAEVNFFEMLEQFSVALVQAVTTVLFASHLYICRINSIYHQVTSIQLAMRTFFFYSGSYSLLVYDNAIGRAYSQQYDDDVDGHRMYATNLWKNGEVCNFSTLNRTRQKGEEKKTEIRAWSQFLSRRSLDEGCYYYYGLINRPNRQPIKRGTRSRKPKRNAAAGKKKRWIVPHLSTLSY